MNKKGQMWDMEEGFSFFLGLFLLILISVIVFFVLYSFTTSAASVDALQTPGVSPVWSFVGRLPVLLDATVVIIYLGMFAVSMWLASKVQETPSGLVMSWIFLIILSGILLIVGYVANEFVQSSAFSSAVAQLTVIPFMAANFLWFVMIYFFGVMIALHGGKDE